MAKTDPSSLTPKRRKVYELTTKGDTPPTIARKLKITRSAVYSHMRHLRLAGLLPDNRAVSRSTPKPRRVIGGRHPDGRSATANGAVTELDQVRNMVTKIREDIAEGLTKANERATELEHELHRNKAERTELMERDERYKQAAEALNA